MRTCLSCGEVNSDRARFCQVCASPLDQAGAKEVRKTVTVLFADVVGSTQLGERMDGFHRQQFTSARRVRGGEGDDQAVGAAFRGHDNPS